MGKMSNYRKGLDAAVNNIGYTIVRLAPIIAPLPALATLLDATGYAVYAWFIVIGVELTGYAIGEEAVKAIRLQVFTPRHLVWALAVYGVVIEGLMLGYKVLPAWAEWHAGKIDLSHAIQALVGILFPAFTLAGAILFAFHEYLEEVQADRDQAKQDERSKQSDHAVDDREFDRQKRQIELDALKTKLAQDAEIEREKALADLRIKEQKAAVKMSVKSTGADGVKSSGRGEDFTPDFTPTKAGDRRVILRDILHTELDGKPIEELNKSALARRLSVTRPTINADLESLIASGELSLNGHIRVS